MRQTGRAIIISSVVLAALLTAAVLYVRETPHYSLYMLKRAVDNRDADEALRYINIDSIVENLAKDLLGTKGAVDSRNRGGKSPLKDMVTDSLPGIKDSLRLSLRKAITSPGKGQNGVVRGGARSSDPEEDASLRLRSRQFSLGRIEIGDLDMERIRTVSVGDLVIDVDGATAVVQIKNNPQIKAKMMKTGPGNWQFTEILFSQ
jgi:hypothetical protein